MTASDRPQEKNLPKKHHDTFIFVPQGIYANGNQDVG